MSRRELTGRTALVTGVTRRAGIGASIARELGRAGAKLFVTFFRRYDEQQIWGVEPNEPEALLSELGFVADDVAGVELDLSQPVSPAELFDGRGSVLTVSTSWSTMRPTGNREESPTLVRINWTVTMP